MQSTYWLSHHASFLQLSQNTSNKLTQKKKKKFYLIISEISVYGSLAHLFPDLWWCQYHGREHVGGESGSAVGKKGRQETARANLPTGYTLKACYFTWFHLQISITYQQPSKLCKHQWLNLLIKSDSLMILPRSQILTSGCCYAGDPAFNTRAFGCHFSSKSQLSLKRKI